MDFKVIWSDGAITDLHGICTYIARDNPEAASRMGNGILDHVRILAQFPFMLETTGAEPLMGELFRIERLHESYLYWPDLDVDLDLDRIEHPERYPLVAGVRDWCEPGAPPNGGPATRLC